MRPRILLLAYSCDPEKGSEASVGWNRAIEAAKYCDTWVICCEQNCIEPVKRYLAANGSIAGLHFVFVSRSRTEIIIGKVRRAWYLAYNLWHRRALRVARRLHERIGFQLVHQVNFIGYREPGYLWKLDVPFIWGPVGGTQNYPWRFLPGAGLRATVSESLRNVINSLQLLYSVRARAAARRAAVLLVANSQGQRDLARMRGGSPVRMLETGLVKLYSSKRRDNKEGDALRILWCGSFEPRKALELLILALSQWQGSRSYQLRVIGAGSSGPRWQRLAQRTGVASRTEWTGYLTQHDAVKMLEWADVFVFTSLRDTSGNVMLEALGSGVPVVCLDHQGAGDIVTDQCGIKIPATTRRDVAKRLRQALELLARDGPMLDRLSLGAIRRAREYLWSEQGERMAKVYQGILNASVCDVRCDGEPRDSAPLGQCHSFAQQLWLRSVRVRKGTGGLDRN